MLFRLSAGSAVELGDVGIQGGALILFASLLWFDRSRSEGCLRCRFRLWSGFVYRLRGGF